MLSSVTKAFEPKICNADDGAVVPMPTLPPVVIMGPTVLLLPIAAKLFVMFAIPAVKFVSIKFVVVTFTATKVPAMVRLPDKLAFAPVIVEAVNQLVAIVLNVPDVALIVPVVILVDMTLGIVLVVTNILPALIKLVTSKVAEVIPVDIFKVPALKFALITFVLISVPMVAVVTLALVN